MQVDERTFRKALSCFASGITVITTTDSDGAPVGVTVSAFSSLSLEPPLVLFCLDRRTRALEHFCRGNVAVNVLREDQRQLSIQFASKMDDKWFGVSHSAGKTGTPVLDGVLAHMECEVQTVHEEGDHVIVIGKVLHVDSQTGGQPLLYFRGAYAGLSEGL